jgi:hypothetical protein
MFPGVNGFHWTFGHILFVSAFAGVLLVIGATVIAALLRSRRDFRRGRAESIRWHADWEDLPEHDRRCRHDIAGEVMYRVCPNGFDCRACGDHPHLAMERTAETGEEYCGLLYPSNRLYHRGHTWVEAQADGTFTVGLDEIAHRLIGKPDEAHLPPAGAAIVNNGTAWRMKKDGVDIRVLAPLDGEVVQSGGPDEDWYLRVKPHADAADLRHLLRGREVGCWVARELERLQMALTPASAHPSLPDGGVLIHEAIAQQPATNWDRVLGAVFLDP